MKSDAARIVYAPRPDTTPEAELSALCEAYRFLILEKGVPHVLTDDLTTDTTKNDPQETESEKTQMAKLTAQGNELLDPGRYVLEVVEAEPVNEYGPQLRLRLRVAEGEHESFEFVDYPNRGAEGGVKVGTKACDVFEACLNRRLSPDEELDTDELVGKRFEAMVVAKKTGKGNRTEHGTIGPHRSEKARLEAAPKPEDPDDVGEQFTKIPI